LHVEGRSGIGKEEGFSAAGGLFRTEILAGFREMRTQSRIV